MSDSKSALVLAFESAGSIGGRYKNLYCVNFRPGDVRKNRGGYSLVFRAEDIESGKPVAIKIMDPDHLTDLYRMDCFVREPQIIEALQAHHRCLRLIEGHKIFDIDVSMGNGGTLKYPVGFFVTEWLEEDIEDYFFRQENYNAVVKLEIYRQIVLAIKVLHEVNVHHRDLKRDNFRVRATQDDLPIIAIDFGTAAKHQSHHLQTSYGGPVGHQGYAPPESFAGLASVRGIGNLGDAYALGAVLYELFMPEFFFVENAKNPAFVAALRAALYKVGAERDVNKRLGLWRAHVKEFSRMVQPPSILAAGSSVPAAVRGALNEVYSQLTAFDLQRRLSDLNVVLRRIDGAIKCLSNEILQQREQIRRRQAREEKLRRALEKEARVAARYGSRGIVEPKGGTNA